MKLSIPTRYFDALQKISRPGLTLRGPLACALALLASLCLSGAATVLDFDGVANNYVNSASKTIRLPTPVQAAGTNDYVSAYSATTRISPPTGYTGPAFYGGSWVTSSDGSVTGLTTERVRYNFPNTNTSTTYLSQIELGMTTHPAATTSGAGFIAFDKSAFAGGASAYSLDNTSSLSLTISTGSESVVRFAILSGGQWYLSAASVAPVSTVGGSLSLSGAELLDSMWAAWDPTGGANGRLGDVPDSFTVEASSLGNIDAVGYYFDLNSSKSNQYADIGNFSADLTPVPEPSTCALALLGLAGIVAVVRRRTILARAEFVAKA